MSRVAVDRLRFSPAGGADTGERRFFEADGAERELQFRGVNVVYKDPPYIPHTSGFHANLSFVEEDVLLLKTLGVNLVRLGVMWPGLVPARGKISTEYAQAIRSIIDMCARHGIYTLLEPHQDELNPGFCGEGPPDWWVKEAGLSSATFPVPVQDTPFPSTPPTPEMCDKHSSFSYIWTHDAAKAYQRLYETSAQADGGSGLGPLGEYWTSVADLFGQVPGVLGGELWNEPFPGDVYDDAKFRDDAYADEHNLQPWYRNLTAGIRTKSQGMLLAYEPSWPVGSQDLRPDDVLSPTSGFRVSEGEPSIFEDQIYAFHWYSAPCTKDLPSYLAARWADARRLRAASFASEFNLYAADAASEANMRDHFLNFEQAYRVSYTGWQYKSFSGSLPGGTCTGCGNSFFMANGSLQEHMASSLGSLPFAQAVAGEVDSIQMSGEPVKSEFLGPGLSGRGERLGKYTLRARVGVGYLRKHREDGATELVTSDWWSGGAKEAVSAHVVAVEGAGEDDAKRIRETLAYRADAQETPARDVLAIGGGPDLRIPAHRHWRVYATGESIDALSGISPDITVVFEVSLEVAPQSAADLAHATTILTM